MSTIKMRYFIPLFILTVCLQFSVVGQSLKDLKQEYKKLKEQMEEYLQKDYPIRSFNTYTAADSIKNELINTGVDTIMLFYQTVVKPGLIKEDGTDDHKVAFLVYAASDTIYTQKINDYAIFRPRKSKKWISYPDERFVFNYFLKHNEDLSDSDLHVFKNHRVYRPLSSHLDSLSKTDEQLTIVNIKVGKHDFKIDFPEIEMRNYTSKDDLIADLENITFVYMLIIKGLINDIDDHHWKPLTDIKYMSESEKQLKFQKLIQQIDDEYQEAKRRIKSKKQIKR